MPKKVIYDFRGLAPPLRYKLLTGLVVPRPIALITSRSKDGVVNAAPYSFFNVFSEDPPLIVIGIDARSDGSMKDSARNVRETGSFVVNLVDETLTVAMNDCAVDFPPEISETGTLGLPLSEGISIAVPHLTDAPAILECHKMMMIHVGRYRELLVGEILGVQVRHGLIDPETLRVDLDAYKPVGRLVGSFYARQWDRFALKRESLEAWSQRNGRNED